MVASDTTFKLVLRMMLMVLGSSIALAQPSTVLDSCSGGTLYYISYPDTVTNIQDHRFPADYLEEFFLYIYSPVDQDITVSHGNGTSVIKSVAAGDILEFDTKEVVVPIITLRNEPQSDVLKVESESPVILYAYMATHFGCGAFTPLPVERWGTEYYAATWRGDEVRDVISFEHWGRAEKPAPAEIVIIAAYDNTQIIIRPTDSLMECNSCTQVTLQSGQSYLVQGQELGNNDPNDIRQADIAGTYIRANKPIGVLSGNTRIWHEDYKDGFLAANSYKDLIAEWIAPINQHGTEFVFMPTWDRLHQHPNADPVRTDEYIRLYGTTEEETDIVYADPDVISGIPATTTPVKRGGYTDEVLDDLTEGRVYRTNNASQAYQSPRSVTQFNGTTGEGNFIGASYNAWGTYMVEMTPREKWGSFAPFKAPSYPADMEHYLNVVTDSSNRHNIFIKEEGAPPQPFPFRSATIPGSDVVWGTMSVTPGLNYTLQGENNAKFSGFLYGSWQGFESYLPAKDPSGSHYMPEYYKENIAMMYGYPLSSSRCKTMSVVDGIRDDLSGYAIDEVTPNPFTSNTEIHFQLGKGGRSTVRVYDGSGKEVIQLLDTELEAGKHRVEWKADGVAGGVYYVRITSGDWNKTQRIVLVR